MRDARREPCWAEGVGGQLATAVSERSRTIGLLLARPKRLGISTLTQVIEDLGGPGALGLVQAAEVVEVATEHGEHPGVRDKARGSFINGQRRRSPAYESPRSRSRSRWRCQRPNGVQMHERLPSASSITQYLGAASLLTRRPPASSTACNRRSASS